MAINIYTGDARRTTCKVSRSTDGVLDTGYPVTYYIYNSFTDPSDSVVYPAITLVTFAQMSDTDYQTRLAAFYKYIEDENPGLDTEDDLIAGYEPEVEDSPTCVSLEGQEDTRVDAAP